jgi:hypothetical protein
MKNGCLVLVAALLLISGINTLAKDTNGVGVLVGAMILVGIGILALWGVKRKNKSHVDELANVGAMVQSWLDKGVGSDGAAFTKDGEQALFELGNIQLLEFKSSGSQFVGGNAGISFPLVGRVRGHVGGTRGEIIKNPEELTIVDTGKLRITSDRLIFIGQKEAREIKIEKLLDVELGPNGLWVKLAMSGKGKREGFQHLALDQIPLGMAIGIANEWHKGGLAQAKPYTENTIKQITDYVAAEKAGETNKKR